MVLTGIKIGVCGFRGKGEKGETGESMVPIFPTDRSLGIGGNA